MNGNYRVMRHKAADGGTTYAMHEAFYDEDGNVNLWFREPAAVVSNTREGTLLLLTQIADALNQPVLDAESGRIVDPE